MYDIKRVKRKKQQPKSLKRKSKFRVTFEPFETSVDIPSGQSLLDAVRKAELPLKTTCGGKGTCGDCVIQITSGAYKKKASAVLPDQLASRGYALSCQTDINDNLIVQLPQFQELSIKSVIDSKFFDKQRGKISGIYELDSLVKKIEIELPSPTLDDNYSDLKRLEKELRKKLSINNLKYEYSVLKKLAHAVRKKQGHISVIVGIFGEDATVMDLFPET
ncbi:MAG: 2Fe-2S iron-sulfur cluster binding domain-containing protein [Candidatus Aminicenantes bacterium]|nr:MAG: 2Fe-2S iron-sulfur cluster binding domain-containing protein [Candidatus Aminicenantes bacterium]